jgi:hypothetical protein
MMAFRLSSALLALTVLAGACTPSFESDLDEVDVIQHGLKVPAMPAMVDAGEVSVMGDVSVTGTVTLSSSGTAWSKRMNSHVLVHKVTITGGSTLSNLDFVQSIHMTVAASDHPENAIEIMNYERSQGATPSLVIQNDIPVPIDITTPWNASKTVITFKLTGELPAQDWTFDIAMMLSGNMVYTY